MPFTVTSTFTGAGTGTWTYVDDVGAQVALLTAAVNAQTTAINGQLIALNTQLSNLNFSPNASEIPGTPAASLQVIAGALNDLANIMASTMDSASEQTAGLRVIATALAGINSQAAASVTTQQLAFADQMHNNEFQQITTNAALERSDLPPTVVPDTSFTDKINKAIDDAGIIKAQTTAVGFVETQIGDAVRWTTITLTGWVAESYIGTSAASAYTTVKQWLGFTKPEELTKKKIAEGKAVTRSTKILGA
jgi:hypothetical protein